MVKSIEFCGHDKSTSYLGSYTYWHAFDTQKVK